MDHRLAALLGRTVEEMRATVSRRAYRRWVRYWIEEPWGPWRDNANSAQVAAVIANAHRDVTKRPQPYTFDDFMLIDADAHREKQTTTTLGNLRAMAKPKPRKIRKQRKRRKKEGK